jgi:uncharacterized membrane protein YgdD (TMEM256/DUF423 family)
MTNPPPHDRFPLLAAGVLGLTGVALGAFGAHGLKAVLIERGMTQAWETAARYHLLHAIALIGVAAWLRGGPGKSGKWMSATARCWVSGTVLFSGSLYWLALGGPRWLGPITPLGGVIMIAGWLLLLVAAGQRQE